MNRFSESGQRSSRRCALISKMLMLITVWAIALIGAVIGKEGIAELKKAIQIRPNFVNAYLNLCPVVQRPGQYKERLRRSPPSRRSPEVSDDLFERVLTTCTSAEAKTLQTMLARFLR